jgi:hypothetical protein
LGGAFLQFFWWVAARFWVRAKARRRKGIFLAVKPPEKTHDKACREAEK